MAKFIISWDREPGTGSDPKAEIQSLLGLDEDLELGEAEYPVNNVLIFNSNCSLKMLEEVIKSCELWKSEQFSFVVAEIKGNPKGAYLNNKIRNKIRQIIREALSGYI
jgi:hypothetical protein